VVARERGGVSTATPLRTRPIPVDAGAVAVEDGGERGALADEDRGGRRRERKPKAGISRRTSAESHGRDEAARH